MPEAPRHPQSVSVPDVSEYREPMVQLPVGLLDPTSHAGAFRLVVKWEYPIELEPAVTGSPTIYMLKCASVRVRGGVLVRSS